jgi:uncharacterized protein (DUF433 family)
MSSAHSTVISMRLPVASGNRLKRMANRYGWTPSDASARLVEEGLRRSEFAFIDFRDSTAGRQACIQGSSLAVWEVVLLVRSYKHDLTATAKHMQWPLAKVQAAVNYAEAFPDEIDEALAEYSAVDFTALKRMLPQAVEFTSGRAPRR